MKCDLAPRPFHPHRQGRSSLWIGLAVVLVAPAAFALTDTPYNAIVGRNAFALKPPTPPAAAITAPVAPPPDVELRGITTLLGRAQVLLNVKMKGKPPEPPKDRSLVLDVGQREGEVEILEINPATGVVRLRNQGVETSLNLKENAAKPQSAAGIAAPLVMPRPNPIPGMPAPTAGGIPAPTTGGASVNAVGGVGGASPFGAIPSPNTQPNLPTRNLRGGNSQSAVVGGFNDPAEQAATIEVIAARNKALIEAGKTPPPPFTGLK